MAEVACGSVRAVSVLATSVARFRDLGEGGQNYFTLPDPSAPLVLILH